MFSLFGPEIAPNMRKQIPQRRKLQSHLGDMSHGAKLEQHRTPYARYETRLNINPSNLVRVDYILITHNKSGCPAEKRVYRLFETRSLIKQKKGKVSTMEVLNAR